MKWDRKRYYLVVAVTMGLMSTYVSEAQSTQEVTGNQGKMMTAAAQGSGRVDTSQGPAGMAGQHRHSGMRQHKPCMFCQQHKKGMTGGQQGSNMMVRGAYGRGMMGPYGRGMMGPYGRGMMGPHGRGMMGPYGRGMMGPHGLLGAMKMKDPTMLGHRPLRVKHILALLSGGLVITQAQEAAWRAYTEASMALTHAHEGGIDLMHGKYDTALAVAEARTHFMVQLIEKRKLALAAFKALFDVLTDEQKTRVNHFFGVFSG